MARTVHELRNSIRTTVGRFERETSTTFTKEDLAAISEAVGEDVDRTGQLPQKAAMRADIRHRIGELETDDPDAADRPFRKAELEAVLATLTGD